VAVDPTHQRFLKNLKASQTSVDQVGAWLTRLGLAVTKGRLGLAAPTHAAWRQFRDNGDLHVAHATIGGPHRLEVKHRTVAFTGAHDFPYDSMIVCAQHAWDEVDPKPWWVLCLNQQATLVAAIDARTNDGWFTRELHDKRYGPDYTQAYNLVPLPRVRFLPLLRAHDAENLGVLTRARPLLPAAPARAVAGGHPGLNECARVFDRNRDALARGYATDLTVTLDHP
jgi:hypothetical protein